jgi:hypothetical protein
MNDNNGNFIHGFISVPVLFKAGWRAAPDAETLREEIIHHRTSDRLATPPPSFADMPQDLAELADFQKTSPHIYRMWITLERKLDYIANMMRQIPANKRNMEECVCSSVSEGGLRLRMDKELRSGEIFFVSLTFPTYPLMTIDALVRVTQTNPRPEKAGEWDVTAEYIAINDIDLEDVIQYVFKRQREMIQMERE